MNKSERMSWYLLRSVLLVLLHWSSTSAQPDKRIILDHADSLVGLMINGEQAQQLIGNVQFTQGSVVVRCRRATRYFESNRIVFEGEADMRDGTLRLVGQRGTYYGDTKTAEVFDRVMLEDSVSTLNARYGQYFSAEKKAFFRTNVVVEDTASILTSDELTYYKDDQHLIAVGGVTIKHARNGITMYGDHFESFRQRKYHKMTGAPRVVQIDTTRETQPDTLIVTASILEAFQDSIERLIATDSVVITRGDLAAEAGTCVFYTEQDSMVLRRSPYVWYKGGHGLDHQVSGDSIFVKLVQRKLHTVRVDGSAMAISAADSSHAERFNQMSGQEIILHFADKKLEQIDVEKTATVLYYLFDDRGGNGANRSSGDHVTMAFREGRIDKLKVTTGVEGQYFPEKMIRNRESEYNLTGFNRKQRPSRWK